MLYKHFWVKYELTKAQYHQEVGQGLNYKILKISHADVTTFKAWCHKFEDNSQTSQRIDQTEKFSK